MLTSETSPVQVIYNRYTESPLLVLIRDGIPADACNAVRDIFRQVGSKFSGHRKINTAAIGGYHDKKLGCRQMELSAEDLRRWPIVLPYFQAANAVFRNHLPERHALQQEAADRTQQRYVVEGTCFTTANVNRWDQTHFARTPVHRDKGDLPAGFGVISVLRRGLYAGGELIFPRHRVAVDLREGDVLLADVHELHGNNEICGDGDWERIAVISYFRTGLLTCPHQKNLDQ